MKIPLLFGDIHSSGHGEDLNLNDNEALTPCLFRISLIQYLSSAPQRAAENHIFTRACALAPSSICLSVELGTHCDHSIW